MLNVKQQLVEMNVAHSDALKRVYLRNDAPQTVTTQQFDWPGIRLESGINNIAAVDDVAGVHHYVSLNLDDRPVTFEIKGEDGGPFERFVLRRGAAWVCPAGDPISVRLNSNFRYVRMSIDPVHFDRLTGNPDGSPIRLRRSYGLANSQIGHILGALVAESDAGNPGGLAFVEALAAGMSHQLALHAGVRKPSVVRFRGGLSPAAKRRTLELMEARLDSNVSVQLLADEVGLSAAHFARAFKGTMGVTPHQYLLHLRLERSRHLLDSEDAMLADVAQRTGFADQAHCTRFFKREYGVTPGSVLKRRRTLTTIQS